MLPAGSYAASDASNFRLASEELRRHLDEVASQVIDTALDAQNVQTDVPEREQPAVPFTTVEKG